MKKIVLLPLLLLLLVSFKADEGNGIEAGEKLVYAGSYNMSGLMTHIAQVTMSTENVNTSKNQYLHLSCELATFSKWDKFFKIRDLYESYVTPGSLKPNLYKRSIDEGGYTKKEKYVFKGNQVTSTVQKRKRPETTRTFTIGANSVDAITLLYKLRSVNFSKMKSGQTKSFTIVFDEKEIPVTLKFMGTETITAGNLGAKSCYKLSIGAKTYALRGKDKNLIWLTADAHKVPALMKFSIPVGTGELKLTSATGL